MTWDVFKTMQRQERGKTGADQRIMGTQITWMMTLSLLEW